MRVVFVPVVEACAEAAMGAVFVPAAEAAEAVVSAVWGEEAAESGRFDLDLFLLPANPKQRTSLTNILV